MQATLIVRTQAELTAALEALILGIDGALSAGRTGGVHVFPPQDLQVSGMMVTSLSAATIDETTTTPANTVTSTNTTPQHTVTTTDTIGAVVESALTTPPGRTTTRQENGGDVTDTSTGYTEY